MVAKAVIAVSLIASVAYGWWILQTTTPNKCVPVLFVHGFGGKGNDWIKKNYQSAFKASPGFVYMGDVSVHGGSPVLALVSEAADFGHEHPFFTISLRNRANDAIPELGDDIELSLNKICDVCRCEYVCLVGFSLGGVVCRDYLVRHPGNSRVTKLITISSPHMGTAFSFLSDFSKRLKAQTNGGVFQKLGEKAFSELNVQCQKYQVDINARSLSMLQPPSPGNYLDWLNNKPHPETVRYFSIVTIKSAMDYSANDALRDLEKIEYSQVIDTAAFSAGIDLIRMGIDFLANNNVSFGDGFVAAESQDMARIPALMSPEIRHQTVEIPSTHFDDVLQKQLVSLILQNNQ